jgi:TAG lipase/lysophosphatidylethanolamine acyltransferase
LGTKRLIEKYHNEVIECIRYIFYYKGKKMTLPQKLEFFAETRHSFGRTALFLSGINYIRMLNLLLGGATFGRYHLGVIKALFDQDLMPRIICGSSVGSIMGSLICCHKYEDIPLVLNIEKTLNKPLLAFKFNTAFEMIMKILNGSPVLDIQRIKEVLYHNCGDITFKEIHDKYKWNLNISVTDSEKTDESRLLNYLTAPNVVVWSAACASSAIPHVFDAVELFIKTETGEI